LSTVSWSNIGEDLAMTISLSGFLSNALPPGAPINPTNVAGAFDKATAAGLNFNFPFSALPLVDALSQLSGESNTQAQQGAFQMGNSYLSLLTDPMSTNKVTTTGTLGYAAQKKLPPAVAAANAMVTKAPPIVYVPHWDVWGAAFGGSNNTRGDAVIVGSHDTYTRVGAVAAGADYRFGPDSMIGFSLAGGNINWTVTNGLSNGGGNSDAFMAGIYGKHDFGAGYVSGALSYSNYWMNTDRNVTVAGLDRLHADFNAQSWGDVSKAATAPASSG
jgi:outer membrane autotransporter protein